MLAYYNIEPVTDHIWAIHSLTGEIMYLIQGDEKAILIDTCLGVKGLRKLVEQTTDKPLTVLLSHGHIDHAPGAPEFDEVYLNPKDETIYNSMCSIEQRMDYIKGNLREHAPQLNKEDFIPAQRIQYHPLQNQMTFNLGNLCVQVISFPGHTPGSMAFLIPEERILITGDACNNYTFLFDENAAAVETYRNTVLEVMNKTEGKYDRIFGFHHQMDLGKDLLKEMVYVCDEVMAGNTDDLPFNFHGISAFVAKKHDRQMQPEYGGMANLVYNKTKVFNE